MINIEIHVIETVELNAVETAYEGVLVKSQNSVEIAVVGVGAKGDNGAPGTTSWTGITDLPETFPPSSHTHTISEVTGLQNALNDLSSSITALIGGAPTDADTLKKLNDKIIAIQTLLNSDNVNLDNVQELVDAIETIQSSLSTILVDDLTTGGTTKALTAEQGKVLKGFIDDLQANPMRFLGDYTSFSTMKKGDTSIITVPGVNLVGSNIYNSLLLSRSDTPTENDIVALPLGVYETESTTLDLSLFSTKIVKTGGATVAMNGTELVITLSSTNDAAKFGNYLNNSDTKFASAGGNLEIDFSIDQTAPWVNGNYFHLDYFLGWVNATGINNNNIVWSGGTWNNFSGSYIVGLGDWKWEHYLDGSTQTYRDIYNSPLQMKVRSGSLVNYFDSGIDLLTSNILSTGFFSSNGTYKLVVYQKKGWNNLPQKIIAMEQTAIPGPVALNRCLFGFGAKAINGIPIVIRIKKIRQVKYNSTIPLNNF